MKRGISLLLAAMLIFTLGITGCGKSGTTGDTASSTQQQPVNTSVVLVSMVPGQTLNPYDAKAAVPDKMVIHQIFDTLVKLNPDYSIAPCLAESWTEDPDGMSVTFKLRKDVTFSDGSQFTAKDVLFSYQKLLATPYGPMYKGMYFKNVEMLDDYTVKVTKATPYELLYNALAEMLYIIPKSLVEADENKFYENPIGTGAFKFVRKDTDGSIVMEANDKYFLGAPQIKKLTVKPPMDFSTSIVALQKGDLDIVTSIPDNMYSQVVGDKNIELLKETGWSQQSMIFSAEPFKSNVKLREAVYHAINPENVLAMAASGNGTVAKNLYAEKLMGGYAGMADVKGSYNPELAKKALKDSGYDTSKTLTFTADPTTMNIMQVVQSDLKAIGLNLEIKQADMSTLVSQLQKGQVPVFIGALGTDTSTAEDMLNSFSTVGDSMKMFGQKYPEYDALMAKILVEKDTSARAALVKQAFEQAKNHYMLVPFYEPVFNIAYNKRISNVHGAATYIMYAGDLKLSK